MNRTPHIHSAFDDDLMAVQTMLLEMGSLVQVSIEAATKAFCLQDESAAEEVVRADMEIDRLEKEINERVIQIIALWSPIAQDLRTLMAVLKISGNLERLGDYAKNMAKRTMILADEHEISGVNSSIEDVSRKVQSQLQDALDSYARRERPLAERVRMNDEAIDLAFTGMFQEFMANMGEGRRNLLPSMHHLFIAKNLERMGDHVTNIAEQVIYMIEGSLPEEERDKGDLTSSLSSGDLDK